LETHLKEVMVDITFAKAWPEVGTLAFEAAKEWGVSLQCHVQLVCRIDTDAANQIK